MHFHLPKPLHGWREFFGEVGVIVLGVLIALGAEQVVEGFHWQHEVSSFRAAVRQEADGWLAPQHLVDSIRGLCVRRQDHHAHVFGERLRR